MRIKFLSVIASFLIVSFALSSCLDSDDNYEFSSDATIHAFGIDTIHGKHYKFTIDQLKRLIYNRDSLPVGSDTIIDRILIDTMDVTGWITSGSPTDTVFVMSDSVDLRPAMNNDAGMLFKAHAADGITIREYKLKINVHLQDPDSLVWTDMQKRGNVFSNTINLGQQKAVVLGDELFVYTSNTSAYRTSTAPDEYNWSEINVSNLPSDVKLTSAVEYNDALYMVTKSKKVFSSTDGAAWTEVTTLGDNVIVLINGFSDRLSGIVEINGKQYFNICKDGKNWEAENTADNLILEEVPAGFPTENISTTQTRTGNGVEKVILVGMPPVSEKETIPWFSLDGEGWASLQNTIYDTDCPKMNDPAIMYYGGMFYCFGGEMDAIYSSITGIAWGKTEKKFLLPAAFKGKGSYSIIVQPTKDTTVAPEDKRDFIWVIFGGNGTKNEVWRGRLNRLGFEIQ
ncbi:DUF6242 domain-containing protein [uncultured Bacteroides sp.]|uniref:DUF6242 domain-containing protein n=1 Tax=uncultured Bacteroides sp. TaxID=162156 RepID=UPI0025950AD6|nr:DUF6242 domain-containing protein [uncultured Bacteroides sp.]